jgi:hypothetical protein
MQTSTAAQSPTGTKNARRRGVFIAFAGIALAAFGIADWMSAGRDWFGLAFVFAGLGVALFGWLQLRKTRKR